MRSILYIVLMLLNFGLMYGLFIYEHDDTMKKGFQIGIVVVTFILFRMYLKDRNVLKKQ